MNETTDLTELNLIFQKINAQSKKSGDHEQSSAVRVLPRASSSPPELPGKGARRVPQALDDNNVSPYVQTVQGGPQGRCSDESGSAGGREDPPEEAQAIFDYYSKMDQCMAGR